MSKVQERLNSLEAAIREEEREAFRMEVASVLGLKPETIKVDVEDGEMTAVYDRLAVAGRKADVDTRYLAYVRQHPHCKGEDVNKALGITGSQASAIRARLGKQIVRRGKKRGATYSIRGAK